MAALNVNGEVLGGVAGALVAAGQSLSALAAAPLAHPAVAPDEVSTSAATRLSAHGATMQSRASDGGQVLNSAARAVVEAVRAYTDMDIANTSLVALSGGGSGASGASFTPAVTTNAQTPSVPIATPVPRYGKITAAMMEAGNSGAGSGFTSGCNAHASAYEQAATAARNAENMVREALTGEAGPKLGAALDRFASWADQMSSHARTVGSAASSHQQRFNQARQSTPATNDFSQTEQQLLKAQQLESRYPDAYSAVIVKLQTQLGNLQKKTTQSLSNYHLGELPAAPPPPPPVVPIVSGAGQPQQPRQGAGASEGRGDRDANIGRGGSGPQEAAVGARSQSGGTESGALEGLSSESDEALDGTGDLAELGLGGAGAPGGGDMSQQMGPIMQALPQALGALMGAVTALPAAAGQAVQQGAQQLMQGASGLAEGFKTDPESELSTTGIGGGPDGLGAGGGGGGGTEPAAAPTDLSPSSAGMMAMGAPAPTAQPLVGATGAANGAQAAAGPGGAPMGMMPPMGGMGAGGGAGARPVKDPDKKVYLPEEPNTEAVRGDVQRRHQAVAEDVLGENKPKAAVTVSSRAGKRVVQPDEGEAEK